MFQSFAWNELAGRIFASREPVRVMLVEDDTSAAIIPMCLRSGQLRLIGETLFDYRDVLCSDASLLPFAWEDMAELEQPFEIVALRSASAVFRWEGLSVEPFANAPAVMRNSISADEFPRTHNRLGRHSRRIRKHGIDLHRYGSPERVLTGEIYQRKGAQGAAESNLFSDPLRREFMVEICSRRESNCEVFTYETAGELVAALVTFRDGSWRRFYTVYYDQRWASLSPGQVLLFEITAESLAEGLDCDFMTGEYPYKTRLATNQIPLYRVLATPAQLRNAARNSSGAVTIAA